jgi:uncharacterized membrane protein YdjX (TVP38/TMEM64 family)
MSAGAWGPLVTVFIYAIFSATPISTDPLTVISGAVFGPLLGIFVAWTGNNLAALVEYYIGMKIGNATNFEEKKDNLPFGLSKMPVDSFLFLTLGRIVPGYGSKVVSIMCGMYRVPLKKYMLAAMLTNLLGAALLSIGGSTLIHLLKF